MFSVSVSNKANIPFYLWMQTDGNLVLYNNLNQAQWSSQTYLKLTQPRLVIQDDGNLVILNPSNQSFWSSNTNEYTRKFTNQATSRCLDSNGNGAVYTLTCNRGQYQNWVLVKYLDGYFTIMNRATGLFLTGSGSSVLARARDGTTSQDWKINGVQVVNRFTNKVLDSNSAGNVYTLTPNTSNYQKWN